MGRTGTAHFSEIMQVADGKGEGRGVKDVGGWRVSYTKGLIFLLLAVCLAIAVGLLMYFLRPCCPMSRTAPPTKTLDQEWLNCLNVSLMTGRCLPSSIGCNTSSAWTPTGPTAAVTPTAHINYRLPSTLVPIHYDIDLKPDIYQEDDAHFAFTGNVSMVLRCSSPTNVVTFHRRRMNISTIDVESENGESLVVTNITEDELREFHKVVLATSLHVGDVIIVRVSFRGELVQYSKGLYWSSYMENDERKYVVVSQLESTSARRAFPCLDEPNLKATFNVTLWRKEPMVALSNMPLYLSEPRGDGWLADHFMKTSVVMPTYLVAFIVCDFSHVKSTATGGIHTKDMRYWARHEAVGKGHITYAESVGKLMFDYLEGYFNESFKLPKLDSIAIPEFRSGAMENWGLVTYRENRLLFDPLESATVNKAALTGTMAHELVHMWLGNIVTCAWWSDIWLQEGAARYFQHMALGEVQKGWPADELFVYKYMWRIMDWDSSGQSHPVYNPVESPEEIALMFDGISYAKGAAVYRMMRFILGEENFHAAIKVFVKKFAYRNAAHDDLLTVMDEQASAAKLDLEGYNVTSIMHPWIKQMGLPVVTVTRQPGSASLTLTQSMLLMYPGRPLRERYPSEFGYRWNIPLTYMTNKDREQKQVWLHRENGSITLDLELSSTDWVIANLDQQGYYRVNYDRDNWRAIESQLRVDHKVFSNTVRGQLIEDAFKLSRAGLLDGVTPMALTRYLTAETAYVPFHAFLHNIRFINIMLAKSPHLDLLRTYVRKRVAAAYERLQWDEKSDTDLFDTYLRNDIIGTACEVGYDPCVAEAKKLFNAWKRSATDKTLLRPDIRQPVLCTGVRYGNDDDWEFVFDRYKKEDGTRSQAILMAALLCSPDHWHLNKLFLTAVDGNSTEIPSWQRQAILVGVSRRPVMHYTILHYLTAIPDQLSNRPKIFSVLAEQFNTREELNMFESYLSKQPQEDRSQYEGVRYSIESSIQWFENNGQAVVDWLREENSS